MNLFPDVQERFDWPPGYDFFFKQFNRAGDVAQLVTHLLSMHTSLDVILHPPTPQFWEKKKRKIYY